MKIQFELLNMPYGVEICQMFLDNLASNPLQPTGPISNPPSEQKNLINFMDIFIKYGECLLAMVGDKKSKAVKDLVIRAQEVVKILVSGNFKKLRLMDGHGRMIYLIYNELKKQGHLNLLDHLEIELVDLEDKVINYHKSVFGKCDKFKIIKSNICSMTKSPDTLVYMNFCGISKSIDEVQLYLKQSALLGIPVVVSFSLARAANKKNYIGT